jgi:CRISPR-associated protein Csd1
MSPLAALKGCYDRLAEDPDSGIAPFGYSEEKISFALMLNHDGRLLQVVDLRDMGGKKATARVLQVPQSFKRPGTTPRSFFLWDKTSFVLGVGTKPKDRSEEHHVHRIAEEHAVFKTFHAQVLTDAEDEGLCALLAFLERWTPEQIDTLDHKDDLLQNPNLVFRLDGGRRFLHQRPAARAIWAGRLAALRGNEGLCLVSGERTALARLHPSIKGVRGGQTAGGSIVSFNENAYESYGKKQGQNAPVSEEAAFAYTTALNQLLRPDSRNRVQIADTSTVFWAESPAPAEEDLVAALFDPPADDHGEGTNRAAERRFDEGAAAKVRDILNQIAKGRPLKEAAPDLREGTRFFVLGLAPNAARIAVRFWHENTLGDLAGRFGEHYQDLALEPAPWGGVPPAVWRLLFETAVQRKTENIPPNLAGEVMRAILTGGRYPRSLLAAAIMRMRADGAISGMRAAICKACLARDFRKGLEKEDIPVGLNRDEPDPAYRLGRLFAVLESVQRAALGNLNASIRDRYYGAASATPAAVFPMLLRTATHHIAGLRKGKGADWVKKPEQAAGWYDWEIGQIIASFEQKLPRSFRLEDQGRFAIGYYHQRYQKKPEAPEDIAAADAATDITEDQED